MTTPRTVPIICAKRPVRSGCVPAVRQLSGKWFCGFCGKRVKVVA